MARLSLAVLASALTLLSPATADATSPYNSQLLSSGHISLGPWADAYSKASSFLSTLNTSEKISIISAGSTPNFTALLTSDSSSAIRNYYFSTTWPAPLSMAMSWNRTAIYAQSHALASEMRARGINLANAPTSQPLGRCAWGGRNGETYGPDAYLNGILFGASTRGIGDAGVIPAGKHWVLNEQETNRMGNNVVLGRTSVGNLSESFSATADDKTMHETYMWSFYDAAREGMAGVMCAMNQVNGTYACENGDVLAGLLKSDIGFPGLVYADVGGQKTAAGAAMAGLDLGNGTIWSEEVMTAALGNGSLSMERLDDMVIRNIIGYYHFNQDENYPSAADIPDDVHARADHASLAREYAANSIVLLKNTNNVLPLPSPKKVAIFGYHAGFATYGPNTPLDISGHGQQDVYRGHLAQVAGSGQGSFAYLITPVYALTSQAVKDGAMLRWMLNDAVVPFEVTVNQASLSDGTQIDYTTQGYAYGQDACLVFLNANSGEGGDRLELWNAEQDDLVNEVASVCNNTIVVLSTAGGPRLVDNWIDNDNVTAVLYTGALGQESGHAIVDVLYGNVNPSGRLAHTIAKNESDYDVKVDWNAEIEFTEGNYIDYKWFDGYNVTPRFEFGFGLSYTTFAYADTLTVMSSNATAGYANGTRAVGGREDLWETEAVLTSSVRNTGEVDGAEVVQLYVSFPEEAEQPVRVLRGFEKVAIAAGDEATVEFVLRRRDLSYWDVVRQEWKVAAGTYTFNVGASSRDLKAQTTLTI